MSEGANEVGKVQEGTCMHASQLGARDSSQLALLIFRVGSSKA